MSCQHTKDFSRYHSSQGMTPGHVHRQSNEKQKSFHDYIQVLRIEADKTVNDENKGEKPSHP